MLAPNWALLKALREEMLSRFSLNSKTVFSVSQTNVSNRQTQQLQQQQQEMNERNNNELISNQHVNVNLREKDKSMETKSILERSKKFEQINEQSKQQQPTQKIELWNEDEEDEIMEESNNNSTMTSTTISTNKNN